MQVIAFDFLRMHLLLHRPFGIGFGAGAGYHRVRALHQKLAKVAIAALGHPAQARIWTPPLAQVFLDGEHRERIFDLIVGTVVPGLDGFR